VTLAALRSGAVHAAGRRSVAVVSGGNIDPATFAAYLARLPAPA
jgi:threonine dehydratase